MAEKEIKIAENGWEYKYLTDLIIKPKFVANAVPNRDKNVKYSALTMKIMDLLYQNINNQVFMESYIVEDGNILFTYDADDLLMSLGSDCNLTITRLNKEITKIMGRVFSYEIGDIIYNECIIPYSVLDVKNRIIKYKLCDSASFSVFNGYVDSTNNKLENSNYVIYDKTKIFSKKFKQNTHILFRLLHTNKLAIMNGKYVVGREYIRDLFGASYEKIALEEKRFFDESIEELSEIGMVVLYKRIYSNLSKTKFKGWKFAVFYDKNKHEKVEGVDDFCYYEDKYSGIISEFDKGYNVNEIYTIESNIKTEVTTNNTKEEFIPEKQYFTPMEFDYSSTDTVYTKTECVIHWSVIKTKQENLENLAKCKVYSSYKNMFNDYDIDLKYSVSEDLFNQDYRIIISDDEKRLHDLEHSKLKKLFSEKENGDRISKLLMATTKYDKYVEVMNKYGFDFVEERYFNLGYRVKGMI